MKEEVNMERIIETVRESKATSEAAALIGRKGGNRTLERYGREHYANLGKGSAAARRRKESGGGEGDERS